LIFGELVFGRLGLFEGGSACLGMVWAILATKIEF